MTLSLNGAGAVVTVDGKTVTVDRSTDLSALDAQTIKALRAADAILDGEQSSDAANLATQATTTLTPSSTVLQVAAYIESGNDGKPLNAPDTVALAGGDPTQARKVLEAEALAQGGDARATVTKPLEKIIADADGDAGDAVDGDTGGGS